MEKKEGMERRERADRPGGVYEYSENIICCLATTKMKASSRKENMLKFSLRLTASPYSILGFSELEAAENCKGRESYRQLRISPVCQIWLSSTKMGRIIDYFMLSIKTSIASSSRMKKSVWQERLGAAGKSSNVSFEFSMGSWCRFVKALDFPFYKYELAAQGTFRQPELWLLRDLRTCSSSLKRAVLVSADANNLDAVMFQDIYIRISKTALLGIQNIKISTVGSQNGLV